MDELEYLAGHSSRVDGYGDDYGPDGDCSSRQNADYGPLAEISDSGESYNPDALSHPHKVTNDVASTAHRDLSLPALSNVQTTTDCPKEW
jgi:hypothetical protein